MLLVDQILTYHGDNNMTHGFLMYETFPNLQTMICMQPDTKSETFAHRLKKV